MDSMDMVSSRTKLLHHCLPITKLRLLEGIVLVASEGPSILMKMAYFENEYFQRCQLFPNQYIISGMEFLEYPRIECGENPAEWHKKSDKLYDYIYIGFIWAGSIGTVIRITRSKKGHLKVLEYDSSSNESLNRLINLEFIPVAAKWLKRGNVLALLSVLNYIVLYERTEQDNCPHTFTGLKQISKIKCSKTETLFSGKIFETCEGEIRVFAGTVFNGICVWDINGDQAIIKHELKCHDGIIFSLEYRQDKRLLLSTSDDRTVAVWRFSGSKNEEEVSLVQRFYGHDARVWEALSVRGYVISVGESSDVRVNILKDGEEHKSWEAHDGAPVFTCAYDEDVEILYTGGSEGSIRKWSKWWYKLQPRILPYDVIPFDSTFENENSCRIQGSGRWAENKDYPKMVVLLDINHTLVSMKSGRVIGLTWEGKQFDLLYDEKCEGYQIISISPNHKILAVAGKDGHFYTAQVAFSENQSSNTTIMHARKLFQNRVSWDILSLIWVSVSRILVVCFSHIVVVMFQEDKNKEFTDAQLVQTFNLNLQRPGVPAAVEILGKHIVVGDESGSLHMFRYHKTNEAIEKNENCHKDGVTSLLYFKDKLYTSGRDGKVRQFSLKFNPDDDLKVEFVPLASYPMPFSWIAGIYVKMDQILVCGFQKEDFIVHSFNEKRTLAKIPCVIGGNRRWDFKYGHGLDGSPDSSFVFVKDKEIFYSFLPMTGCLNVVLKEGLHSRTINCGIRLHQNNEKTDNCIGYLTGSEDGSLKWFRWDRKKCRILSTQNMLNHVSSVRCAWKITLDDNTKTFIFTGGGRSQLCIFNLDSASERLELIKDIILVKTICKQSEADVRIMDTGVLQQNIELWCFGACSDGFVRVLYFNVASYKFKIVGVLKGNGHAVMRIHLLKTKDGVLVCGVTSNGFLIVWRWGENEEPLRSSKMPIPEREPLLKKILRRTAFLSMKIFESGENGKYFIVCGGDDCSVSLWALTLEASEEESGTINLKIKEEWTRDQIQRGAVVGVGVLSDNIYSISNDQIIGFWDLKGKLKRTAYAGVSDCQGFIVDKSNECILCYGKGVSWVSL